MRIAVCDDDVIFLDIMKSLLGKVWQEPQNHIRCYECGEKLWDDYLSGTKFDVVFMDIELKKSDGISIGKKLKECDEEMLLIFLTNYKEYAIKGYEAKAFRYLLKPVDEQMLKRLLGEISRELNRKQTLHIPLEGEDVLVGLSKILYVESDEKYTIVQTEEGSYLTRKSLNEYESMLSEKGFYRIHRKYLVNMYQIEKWKPEYLTLQGKVLPISRRKRKEFRERLYDFLEKGIQK